MSFVSDHRLGEMKMYNLSVGGRIHPTLQADADMRFCNKCCERRICF